MSLSLTLNNALSGLNVSQHSLSVLANNVANANTPGYSRQVVDQSPNVLGTQGAGARVDDIVRKIDEYLQRSVRLQSSDVGKTGVVNDYMQRIQIMLGQPGNANSLDEYIQSFFNELQALGESPELTSFRYEAVQAGQTLATELSTQAAALEDLRYQANQDLEDAIDRVNQELVRLKELNNAIYRANSYGQSTANLLDQRDLSIKKISDYIDVKVNQLEGGQVYMYTTGGVALLENIPYQIQYSSVTSANTFINDQPLAAITVDGLQEDGRFVGRPIELVSSGVDTDIVHSITSGKMKGLLDLRDREIPAMLDQLDEIAAMLRDKMNEIHNSGSGFPPATKLTGDRLVGLQDSLEWTGTVRIAALNSDGTAISSRYGNVTDGYTALDLNLDEMQSEFGDLLTVESLIKEINNHFLPQPKVEVGNMNNITLSTLQDSVAGGAFEFDFELENLSDSQSNFWILGGTILDDGGVDITNGSATFPGPQNIDAAASLTTTLSSNVVTVAHTAHGLSEGDVVYMNGVAGTAGLVNGIPIGDFNGQAFTISNVTANSYEITVATAATSAGAVAEAAATTWEAWGSMDPGSKGRIGDNGTITADFSGNPTSAYYTLQMSVLVEDGNGNQTTSTIQYQVPNNQNDVINRRYPPQNVTGGGTLNLPTASQSLVRAYLADADGNPVGANEDGYLVIEGKLAPGSATERYTIAIDDLSSKDLGRPNDTPAIAGSGRGFSHYFGLNNFFVSNDQTATGDTISGSAINLAVRQSLLDDPNLISLGSLTRTPSDADPNTYTNWSYERTVGNGSVAQQLADLSLTQHSFGAAGGLPSTVKTFNSYMSEILGYVASEAVVAEDLDRDANFLLEGFEERFSATTGVNIDEEMANSIIYQNAYNASAQVIGVVKELFDTLLATF